MSSNEAADARTTRLAYLVSRYPAVTHAFIAEEVRGMRRAGVEVSTYSVRRASEVEVLSDSARTEAGQTRFLVPVGFLRLLATVLIAFATAPRAFVATLWQSLGRADGSPRGLLWRVFYFAEALLLWSRLRSTAIRHVHVHFPNVASDVALLATSYANRRRAGDRRRWTWSVTLHGPTEFADVRAHDLAAKVGAADLVVCTSNWAASQVTAWAGGAESRVRVVPCGVDLARFSVAGPRRSVPRPALAVLTVAGLTARKGHRYLLEAVAALGERGMVVDIVGAGPEGPHLEAMAHRLGIAGLVRFHGALGHDEVAARYAMADVFCLPSLAEGVPFVLMEAMACAIPVVTTWICGVPELLTHEQEGLLVPPADAAALAEAFGRLHGEPELRERLGRQGRARMEAERDLDDRVGELADLIGSVSGR